MPVVFSINQIIISSENSDNCPQFTKSQMNVQQMTWSPEYQRIDY